MSLAYKYTDKRDSCLTLQEDERNPSIVNINIDDNDDIDIPIEELEKILELVKARLNRKPAEMKVFSVDITMHHDGDATERLNLLLKEGWVLVSQSHNQSQGFYTMIRK